MRVLETPRLPNTLKVVYGSKTIASDRAIFRAIWLCRVEGLALRAFEASPVTVQRATYPVVDALSAYVVHRFLSPVLGAQAKYDIALSETEQLIAALYLRDWIEIYCLSLRIQKRIFYLSLRVLDLPELVNEVVYEKSKVGNLGAVGTAALKAANGLDDRISYGLGRTDAASCGIGSLDGPIQRLKYHRNLRSEAKKRSLIRRSIARLHRWMKRHA